MTDPSLPRVQTSPRAGLDSGDSTDYLASEDDVSPTSTGSEDGDPPTSTGSEDGDPPTSTGSEDGDPSARSGSEGTDPSARSESEDSSLEENAETADGSLPENAECADRGAHSGRRLLLDAMLGKLARYLRMCGYDAAYALDRGVEADAQLLQLAREDARVLITRNRRLAERADRSILVESKQVLDQLRELREASLTIELSDQGAHCGSCNGSLETLPETADRPDHAPAEGPVWRCIDCDQLFWKGSHWESVRERLAAL